ncbi:MAG: biotin/lipoyl-binding protein, partial [Pseudomonadota bacterium]
MPRRDLVPVEHRDWSSSRDGLRDTIFLGAAVVAVALFGLGGWAAVAHIDGAIVAPGYISVESNRKSVQHLEGGIVRNILVGEGDAVRAGDTLIVLDDTTARAQYAQLETQICELLARFARLTAERNGAATVVFPDELLHRVNETAVVDLMKGQKAVFETRKVRLETEAALLMERKMQFRDEIASLEKQRGAVERQIALIGKELQTA